MRHRQIPLWIPIVGTVYCAVLIPAYWTHYGPANFLWFSDIALFAAVIAAWRENPLLASMMLLAVLIPETAWNIGFFSGLTVGTAPFGLADYMFEADRPLQLRALSLFHIPLPVMLVYLVYTLGYDRRALVAQTLLAWVVLPASYVLSTPVENINWVYGPGDEGGQERIHPLLWLGGLMLAYPLLLYVPTHLLVVGGMQGLGRPVRARYLRG